MKNYVTDIHTVERKYHTEDLLYNIRKALNGLKYHRLFQTRQK